jgi:hypothetical protein
MLKSSFREQFMLRGTTVTGRRFHYSGSLAAGLVVSFKSSVMKITPVTVRTIRTEIANRSPVLMGANRKPRVRNSVGETLYEKHRVSPQAMSYVLPLLIEEGFCTVNDRKPFVIHRNIGDIHGPTLKMSFPSAREVKERLACSLEMLKTDDEYLFRKNLNERTFTHKLAEHLQCHFSGCHVDCEYNRDGTVPKELFNLSSCQPSKADEDGCTVFPDIIVHQRGKSGDGEPTRNLLVIEAKKSKKGCISNNSYDAEHSRDYEKLRLYKKQLGYRHSAFVIFWVGQDYAACELDFDPK